MVSGPVGCRPRSLGTELDPHLSLTHGASAGSGQDGWSDSGLNRLVHYPDFAHTRLRALRVRTSHVPAAGTRRPSETLVCQSPAGGAQGVSIQISRNIGFKENPYNGPPVERRRANAASTSSAPMASYAVSHRQPGIRACEVRIGPRPSGTSGAGGAG